MEIKIKLTNEQIDEIIKHITLYIPETKNKRKLNLKEKVKLLRAKGFSTRETGKLLNISRQTVLNYEK